MRKSVTLSFAAAVVLALAVPVLAGGFYVVLGNPEANAEARAHNAVLTIKMAGCHEPEKATVTATAVGIVDGRRQTIPLKLTPLSEPGAYALSQQWPPEGRFVLQIVAAENDRVTNALVSATAGGIDRAHAKYAMAPPSAAGLNAMLEGLSGSKVAQK